MTSAAEAPPRSLSAREGKLIGAQVTALRRVNAAVLTGRPDPCVSQSHDHNRSGQRSGLMDGLAGRAIMCRGGDSSSGGGRGVFVPLSWRPWDFPVASSLLF